VFEGKWKDWQSQKGGENEFRHSCLCS
jgi:hypothetical protein